MQCKVHNFHDYMEFDSDYDYLHENHDKKHKIKCLGEQVPNNV